MNLSDDWESLHCVTAILPIHTALHGPGVKGLRETPSSMA